MTTLAVSSASTRDFGCVQYSQTIRRHRKLSTYAGVSATVCVDWPASNGNCELAAEHMRVRRQ